MVLWAALALATPSPEDDAGPGEDAVLEERAQWGGIALPFFSANSTDGFGLGAGGEVFRKPTDPTVADAYDLKLTVSTYFTVNGRYQSHFLQLETRGERDWLVQAGFAKWTSLVYAGQGGRDVRTLRPPEAEGGNGMVAPYGMLAVTVPVGQWEVLGQAFARYAHIRPDALGLLDLDRPFGSEGGFYGDVALGLYRDETNRWPLPHSGWLGEASVRGGVGVARDGEVQPVWGPHLEAAGWWSPGSHLTIGARGIASRSFGQQPMFVQDLLPGRWRDEVGYDQPLTGYGRTRPRGDGVVAALVEVRPYVGRAQSGFFDLALYGSFFAESAYLFDQGDPGPHMPTVGLGPVLVWQEGTILRPFVAWGWRADPGGERRPVMQFGLGLKDPL